MRSLFDLEVSAFHGSGRQTKAAALENRTASARRGEWKLAMVAGRSRCVIISCRRRRHLSAEDAPPVQPMTTLAPRRVDTCHCIIVGHVERARNHQGRRAVTEARTRRACDLSTAGSCLSCYEANCRRSTTTGCSSSALANAAQARLAAWARDVNNRSASSAEELANPAYAQQTLQCVLTRRRRSCRPR